MLKSCSRCGKIHDANYVCYSTGKQKKDTDANKFRRTNAWHVKSKDIKERDNYLCKICINNLYNTTSIYNYNKIEVHHIVPINEDYDKRLNDDNLISLCCYHHKLADNKVIPRIVLSMLVANADIEDVRKHIKIKNTPLHRD